MEKSVDIREDIEQERKCQEVLELLVAAGYFRARIKGLSNFDKIVGGLVWCIETCDFDLDILLFQEDWSIGKKIQLTEKIVSVLRDMKCPHIIEPHQIQGLDYIHIYPVFQWLVAQVLESRDARGEIVRRYSTRQFGQFFKLQTHQDETDGQSSAFAFSNSYAPQRKYRQKDPSTDFSDPESNVSLTLLEYGRIKAQPESGESGDKNEMQDDKFVESASEDNTKLNVKLVTNLINLQSQELHRAADQYTQLKEQLHRLKEVSSPSHLIQSLNMMETKKSTLHARMEALAKEKEELASEKFDLVAKTSTDRRKMDELKAQMAKDESRLSENDSQLIEQLQFLVLKNESYKKKENEFKKFCKEEMTRLTEQNKLLQDKLDSISDNSSNSAKGESDLRNTLERLREDLANKSRLVGELERKLDSVPSRYELDQYQRRFFELDHQQASEYGECQQFVTLYNSLIDQRMFMEREVTLLSSVLELTKHQMMDQLWRLLQGVQSSRSKVEQSLKDQQVVQDGLNEELSALLEDHRHYNILVRDMREEMKKNEALSARLASQN